MRVVALEEHFTVPALVRRIDPEAIRRRGWPSPGAQPPTMSHDAELADLGPARLADMDAAGITVQVLSVSGPGADLVDGDAGVQLARDYNDALAQTVAAHPDRYAGFAHLPMRTPEAAADELERCTSDLRFRGALINGLTEDRFLDDPRFAPLLARAERLGVPLYLHPGIPPEAVRHAYYDGLPGQTGFILSMAGWGWHAETAVHVLRLALSGTLDRYPNLKLIVGHMGEGLEVMMARVDNVFGPSTPHLTRPVSRAVRDQVWVTTSGFFSQPPFAAAVASFGADRILFSVDYPYSPNAPARAWLDALDVSREDREKIAHGNADALLGLAR